MESTLQTIPARGRRGKSPGQKTYVPRQIRNDCAERGIDAVVVAQIREGMKAELEAGPCRRREMRQLAWQLFHANHRGVHPFWRHGFRAHWGKRVDAHDYTVIPGYDELFEEVTNEFPEWRERDMSDFYDELLSPCPRLETAAELWNRAFDAAVRLTEAGPLAATAANQDQAADCDF